MTRLSAIQKHLLGGLFDLMKSLSLEVEEARILRKTLGYSQEELKGLTGDIGKKADQIRQDEDEAMARGVGQEDISKMEEFFKLGKVIHPDGWLPPNQGR